MHKTRKKSWFPLTPNPRKVYWSAELFFKFNCSEIQFIWNYWQKRQNQTGGSAWLANTENISMPYCKYFHNLSFPGVPRKWPRFYRSSSILTSTYTSVLASNEASFMESSDEKLQTLWLEKTSLLLEIYTGSYPLYRTSIHRYYLDMYLMTYNTVKPVLEAHQRERKIMTICTDNVYSEVNLVCCKINLAQWCPLFKCGCYWQMVVNSGWTIFDIHVYHKPFMKITY